MSNIIKLKSDSPRFKVKLKENKISDALEEDELRKEAEQQLFRKKLEDSFNDGFTKGYEEAENKFREEYKNSLENRYAEIMKLFHDIKKNIDEYGRIFEKLVIKLSFIISEKIIKREIDKATIVDEVIKKSLTKIIGANSIHVRLNPMELEKIKEEGGKLFSEEALGSVKFEPDERIDKGGCLVVTDIGNVDGRISSQLDEIQKQIDANYSEEEN